MTFFANAGVAWPKHEQQTTEAGEKSLDAAARLFSVLAKIEGKRGLIGADELKVCASELDQVATIYSDLADQLVNANVSPLSPSEIEFAALPRHRGYREDSYFELFSNRRSLSIEALYRELSQRASRLSSAVKVFDPTREAEDLTASVFQMMQLWESMAILARVISTLGRRKPAKRS